MLHRTISELRVPPVVQVITIDAMNTLIKPRIPVSKSYEQCATKYGLKVDESALISSFPSIFKSQSKSSPCYGYGKEGPYNWWKTLIVSSFEEAGSGPIPSKIAEEISKELYNNYSNGSEWSLVDPDIPSVLSHLRMKGIALCVVSNFDHRLKSILSSLDLSKYFHMIVLSGELGIEKPDRRIFDIVLRHFDLNDPSTLLHIGDDLKKDFNGAKSMGARALLFDPKRKYEDTVVTTSDRLEKFNQLNVY